MEKILCPYCGKKMKKGYVITNGAVLMFALNKWKIIYSPETKEEVSLDVRRLGAYKEAHCCYDCKKIVIDY